VEIARGQNGTMADRTRYEANVCVLLHRAGRWLLSVRAPDVSYAPGQIGLIGGHVEPVVGPDVLEVTARREVLEETGIDLTGVPLRYLCSELYLGADGQPVLTVSYLGELAAEVEARAVELTELTAVGWWTLAELTDAEQCSPWVPPLVAAAERLLNSSRVRTG
jgi:8-oxo-dGTP diphosphatase